MTATVGALTAAVMLVLPACGGSAATDSGPDGPVRINSTGSSEEMAVWIADAEGIFARNGLTVEISEIAGAGLTPIALQNGEVDLGIQTGPDFLQARAQGLPVTAVTSLSINTPDNPRLFVVAGPGGNVTEPDQLAGKRIGVPSRGGSFEVSTVEVLAREGIDTSGIQWVEVPFAQMRSALEQGTVDAVAASVVVKGSLAAAGNPVVLDLSAFGPRTLVTFLSADSSWAAEHAEEIDAVRRSLQEASEFAAANRERVAEIVAERTGLPPDVAANITPPVIAPDVDADQLRAWADAMTGQDMLDQDIDVEEALTP